MIESKQQTVEIICHVHGGDRKYPSCMEHGDNSTRKILTRLKRGVNKKLTREGMQMIINI